MNAWINNWLRFPSPSPSTKICVCQNPTIVISKVIEIQTDNSVMIIFWADCTLNKTNKFEARLSNQVDNWPSLLIVHVRFEIHLLYSPSSIIKIVITYIFQFRIEVHLKLKQKCSMQKIDSGMLFLQPTKFVLWCTKTM